MDHTPQSSATDDRPLRLLERADLPDDHKQRLFALVRSAQAAAVDAGEELQSEFGKTHVALICKCNQFLRLHRGGEEVGRVELLLEEADRVALEAAGFTLHQHPSSLFRMFGWAVVDPMEGNVEALDAAVAAAFARALSSKGLGLTS